ncbi:MAG: EamA family transporter [Deltaproteobacteria bacterium]|nr:EamA family transporter [Deltaproteobacteria bacterium]
MKKTITNGYLFVILASLGFSAKSVLVKVGYTYGADAESLMLLRVSIALPLVFFALLAMESLRGFRINTKDLFLHALVGGGGLGCAMLFSFYSLSVMDASVSVLVIFTYPAITVLLLLLLGRERRIRYVLAPLALTFTGLLMALRIDSSSIFSANLEGTIYGLISAFSFATYNVMSKRLLRNSSPIRTTAFSTTFVVCFMVAVYTLQHSGNLSAMTNQILNLTPEIWVISFVLALFSGFLPFLFFLYGIEILGAGRTVIISSVGPVFTILWAGIFLGERLDTVQVTGMIVVVVGIVALKLTGTKKDKKTEEEKTLDTN